MKHTKNISFFILSLAILFGVSIYFFAGMRTIYAQSYCYPNLAVYPDGKDPCCVNHAPTGRPGCSNAGSTVVGNGNLNINSSTANPSATSISVSCSPSVIKDFKSFIEVFLVGCFLTVGVRLLIGIAIVFFLWGVFKFVRSSEGGEERKSGKEFMIYGLIGLFVIVSPGLLSAYCKALIPLNLNYTP